MKKLEQHVKAGPYQGYAYSYPHKMAYRPFENPLDMRELWKEEKKDSLFLYIHVPFCEMRCGFCNLFTMANPKEGMENPYLPALERQARVVREAIGEEAAFARLAIGGGTPSFLGMTDLERLFDLIHKDLGLGNKVIPASMEVSPKTVTKEKLILMRERGINRVSIGIQSFIEEETKHLGRPQKLAEATRALDLLRSTDFHALNVDLIYGGRGQTRASWQASLERCMQWKPEEIFLYPLYVRALTGLDGRTETEWMDFRLQLYRDAREFLLQHGYQQITMRVFRLSSAKQSEAPPYNSPEDGMVGLGVGARSYTKGVHYSADYAVGRKGVKHIIQDYNESNAAYFKKAYFGIQLSLEEQRIRYIIKSLLEGEDLDLGRYTAYFGSAAFDDLPHLKELLDLNFGEIKEGKLALNSQGIELSDAIGSWLYSEKTRQLMEQYDLT